MREYPISLSLTDDAGIPISNTDGIHTIEATGAQTKYFYLSHDGSLRGEILNIKYTVDASVTLTPTLEIYIGSAWIAIPAHSASAIAAGGNSQKWNGTYPTRELIVNGMKIRLSIATGGAANIYAQIIGFKN